MRLRQIAVPGATSNLPRADRARFREHGIPYFADRRRAAAITHCLCSPARPLQSHVVRGRTNPSSPSSSAALADVTPDEADEIENYVLLHRVKWTRVGRCQPVAFERKRTRRTLMTTCRTSKRSKPRAWIASDAPSLTG